MKRSVFLLAIFLVSAAAVFAQQNQRRYEAEMLRNEGKDTREFNSIVTFGSESMKVVSSRDAAVYKEIKYADVKSAEISYSAFPQFGSEFARAILLALDPHYWSQKPRKRWLTVMTGDDFLILKLEKDNYKLIKAELEIKKIKVEVISED